MNLNKILLSGIAGAIAMFFLGWLIYGMALNNYMATHGNQCAMLPMEEFKWWSMIVSNLAAAILFALILTWSNRSGAAEGAKIGAVTGLLFGISIDLSIYSMSSMFADLAHVCVDVAAFTVMSSLTAAVVGWVLAMGKKPA